MGRELLGFYGGGRGRIRAGGGARARGGFGTEVPKQRGLLGFCGGGRGRLRAGFGGMGVLWCGARSLGGWEHGWKGGDEIPPLRAAAGQQRSGRNDIWRRAQGTATAGGHARAYPPYRTAGPGGGGVPYEVEC